MSMKILVTPTSLKPEKASEALTKLSSFCDDIIFNPTGKPLSEAELIPLLKDCDGYLAGLDSITEQVLKSCSNLKAISRYGAGYDRVDIGAAQRLGIKVSNTPGANAEAVAELTFALILALSRNITYLNTQTRAGQWVRSTGIELFGKTIGIMGLGAIGKLTARCAAGFGMKVQAYDPYISESYCQQHQIDSVDLDTLIRTSDVIAFHLPLTPDTYHIIDTKAIDNMKQGTILVNASRGGMIDEEAAYQALKTGKLRGMGLDAFEIEPPLNSPLFELDNVIVTPHTGAHTQEASEAMSMMAVDNLIAMLSGADCKNIVNSI